MRSLCQLSFATASVAAFAILSLTSLASAAAPSAGQWAKECVQHRLLSPLAKQESKRPAFSRAAPPPDERRVKVTATTFSTDAKGREFIPYVVDVRYGDSWHSNLQGCVYRGSGEVLVQLGDEFRPAAFLLGKEVAAVAGACMQKGAPKDA